MHHLFLYATASTLDGENPEAIEIAAVRTDGNIGIKASKKSSVLAACLTKVKPERKSNHPTYSESEWKDAPTEAAAYKTLHDNLIKPFGGNKFVVICHHTDVVRKLVKPAFPVYDRVWIDLRSLVWPLVFNGSMQSVKLDVMCHYFKIDLKADADAGDVCTAMVKIYTNMMRRYNTALTGEGILSDIGGEPLSAVRDFLGF